MTSYTVSGRTFPHRDLLKAWRGEWDGERWTLRNPSAAQLAKLGTMPGIIITEYVPPVPVAGGGDWAQLIAGLTTPRETLHSNRKTALYGDDPTLHNCFADQNPVVHFGFSNLAAYVDYIERHAHLAHDDERNMGWRGGGLFTGTQTMSEAFDLARNGWQEGVDRAQAIVEHIGVRHAVQRRRSHGIAGGSVNVGRLLAGNPAHMIRRPKLPGRRVVTLFVETGCNGNISVETLQTRAAVVAAVADVMEQNGYSCEIVATDTSLDAGKCMMQLAVRLKNAGERLNLADVVFALGHPSMIRRFSFAATCSAVELRSIWRSQGSAADMFTDDNPPPRNAYYVKHVKNNLHGDDVLGMLAAVFPDGLELADS